MKSRKNVYHNKFQKWQQVKVSSSSQFKGFKLGIVAATECPKKDGGIYVWLTGESTPEQSVYACIQTERGDTIVSIEKEA